MRKSIYLALVLILAIVSVGCVKEGARPEDGIINPGDRVGDFIITIGEGEQVTYVTQLHCPFDEATFTESCELPLGTRVNVSQGIYKSFDSKLTLDEVWSGMVYEMTIEGYPVDLQSFGPVEFKNQVVGTVRTWNVVVSSDKPGKITAYSSGEVDGNPFEYTAVITFANP